MVAPDVNPALEATTRVHVDVLINRCLADVADADALRRSVDALGQLPGQRAEFAFCFFSLELARMGEAKARGAFTEHAGVLLQAHRDSALAHKLLGGNPELTTRWMSLEALLREFDQQVSAAVMPDVPGAFAPTSAESVPVSAVDDAGPLIESAFASRSNAPDLSVALDRLTHIADERRREFCLCLFNLELARLGEDAAKREFAGRAALLWEAYADAEVAATLVGTSSELSLLWTDLVPYLDEFFDTTSSEEDSEFIIEPGPKDEVEAVTAPETSAVVGDELVDDASIVEEEDQEAELSDADIVEDVSVPRTQKPPPPKRPPPPPTSVTPQPGRIPAFRPTTNPGRMPMLREGPTSAPKSRPVPPPPPPSTVEPTPDTARFWTFAEKALDLLPDADGQLSGRQAFAIATKKERHQLQRFATSLTEEFPASPQARALASLVHLHLGSHLKEKTLFGKPNEQRLDHLRTGLSLMTGDSVAAGQAAVLFENDGVATLADFGRLLDLVHGYLGFCSQNALDPLGSASIDRFLGV